MSGIWAIFDLWLSRFFFLAVSLWELSCSATGHKHHSNLFFMEMWTHFSGRKLVAITISLPLSTVIISIISHIRSDDSTGSYLFTQWAMRGNRNFLPKYFWESLSTASNTDDTGTWNGTLFKSARMQILSVEFPASNTETCEMSNKREGDLGNCNQICTWISKLSAATFLPPKKTWTATTSAFSIRLLMFSWGFSLS